MTDRIIIKRCGHCKQIKLVSEFSKSTRAKDGLQAQCRICRSEYLRKYQKTEKGKAALRSATKKYRLANPEKIKAKDTVSNAIQADKLPRANTFECDCGEQAKQYHHPSYAPEHRLDVVPLCRACHKTVS